MWKWTCALAHSYSGCAYLSTAPNSYVHSFVVRSVIELLCDLSCRPEHQNPDMLSPRADVAGLRYRSAMYKFTFPPQYSPYPCIDVLRCNVRDIIQACLTENLIDWISRSVMLKCKRMIRCNDAFVTKCTITSRMHRCLWAKLRDANTERFRYAKWRHLELHTIVRPG